MMLKASLNHCITKRRYGKWCYYIVAAVIAAQKHCVLFNEFSGSYFISLYSGLLDEGII